MTAQETNLFRDPSNQREGIHTLIGASRYRHMQPQIAYGTWLLVEHMISGDPAWIPLIDFKPTGPQSSLGESFTGWCFRLSAPGYLDCTDWTPVENDGGCMADPDVRRQAAWFECIKEYTEAFVWCYDPAAAESNCGHCEACRGQAGKFYTDTGTRECQAPYGCVYYFTDSDNALCEAMRSHVQSLKGSRLENGRSTSGGFLYATTEDHGPDCDGELSDFEVKEV